MKCFPFFALLAFCVSDVVAADPRPVVSSETLVYEPLGYCSGADGRSVDLRRVLILENRAVERTENGVHYRVRVHAETLLIDVLSGGRPATHYYDIDEEISESLHLDINLKIAVVDGRLAVYWRETFQHQQFRQGLFRIDGEHISPLCQGYGGETVED